MGVKMGILKTVKSQQSINLAFILIVSLKLNNFECIHLHSIKQLNKKIVVHWEDPEGSGGEGGGRGDRNGEYM